MRPAAEAALLVKLRQQSPFLRRGVAFDAVLAGGPSPTGGRGRVVRFARASVMGCAAADRDGGREAFVSGLDTVNSLAEVCGAVR